MVTLRTNNIVKLYGMNGKLLQKIYFEKHKENM